MPQKAVSLPTLRSVPLVPAQNDAAASSNGNSRGSSAAHSNRAVQHPRVSWYLTALIVIALLLGAVSELSRWFLLIVTLD